MKYLDLHGDRVAYREAGAGETLLPIHGMAGSSATWRSVLPHLLKRYRVVTPDLLGHGESAKPCGDCSLRAFAAWLRDLLDELGITRATVIGRSLGGGVAMQFTYQHRDYCQRLVLVSSGGLGPDLTWILRILSAPGAELILLVVAPQPVPNIGNRLGSWLIRLASIHHAPARCGTPTRHWQTAAHDVPAAGESFEHRFGPTALRWRTTRGQTSRTPSNRRLDHPADVAPVARSVRRGCRREPGRAATAQIRTSPPRDGCGRRGPERRWAHPHLGSTTRPSTPRPCR
jgi:pimeloyl-ACP methyl ester carboxylesterase